jgi:N-acetylmuramoyl-L-alanine amidase
MMLLDKRKTAIESGADLLVSIHANAAGTRGGYLGVGGTSTYYHNPFWADLAERMYDHLLELDLNEFGVVGSFNYTVIRVSQMPSILVEQAFMTHAEDEEKLASPEFRQAMAERMYEGILDFLTNMKKE